MSRYCIVTDQDRCISCKACEVHCKVANNVPVGARLGMHIASGPHDVDGRPDIRTMFMPCFQCDEPWCVPVCPTGAIAKRESDGIVAIDADTCVGCKACITACPWRVPQWNPVTEKAVKCDLCRDRLDAGLRPACVTACTTHALELVSAEVGASLPCTGIDAVRKVAARPVPASMPPAPKGQRQPRLGDVEKAIAAGEVQTLVVLCQALDDALPTPYEAGCIPQGMALSDARLRPDLGDVPLPPHTMLRKVRCARRFAAKSLPKFLTAGLKALLVFACPPTMCASHEDGKIPATGLADLARACADAGVRLVVHEACPAGPDAVRDAVAAFSRQA